jgi:hypothetical protein
MMRRRPAARYLVMDPAVSLLHPTAGFTDLGVALVFAADRPGGYVLDIDTGARVVSAVIRPPGSAPAPATRAGAGNHR